MGNFLFITIGKGDNRRIISRIIPRSNGKPLCSGCGKLDPGYVISKNKAGGMTRDPVAKPCPLPRFNTPPRHPKPLSMPRKNPA